MSGSTTPAARELFITRSFAAPRDLVWNVHESICNRWSGTSDRLSDYLAPNLAGTST